MSVASAPPRLRDVVLFLHAARITTHAHRNLHNVPLRRLAVDMTSLSALPRQVDPDAAVAASNRACTRLARWLGMRDTCLVRSLVLGALLSDHRGLTLHVAFVTDGDGERHVSGHAWLSLAGRILPEPDACTIGGRIVDGDLALSLQRGR